MTFDKQIAELQQQIDALKNQVLTLTSQVNQKDESIRPIPTDKKDLGLTRFRALQKSA